MAHSVSPEQAKKADIQILLQGSYRLRHLGAQNAIKEEAEEFAD